MKNTVGESGDTCSDGNWENAPFPHGLTAILQCSAPPRQQRLGYFWRFLPLPSGGIARVQRSTVPPHQRLGCFLRYLPLPSGDTAPARPSVASPRQRLGQFCLFLPLPSWITVILQHPRANGRGIFRDFHHYLRRTPPHNPGVAPTTCAALSAFKSSAADHQVDLSYTTAPVSVRNGLASASRTERCRFSVPHVSASGPRTGEGSFLYRTENRPEVIEL